MQLVTTVTDYDSYLSAHSRLHMCSRYVHMNTFKRLTSDTDIATLQAQIDALRNVVCRKQAPTT